jgi:arylsulfatase A-like enzyme
LEFCDLTTAPMDLSALRRKPIHSLALRTLKQRWQFRAGTGRNAAGLLQPGGPRHYNHRAWNNRYVTTMRGRGMPAKSIAMLVAVALISNVASPAPAADAKPNIVFVLCDDLGYGDVGCLNPQGKIATPNIDRIAREGMTFTDAHSGSAVCSPTRYGLITGRYAWRSRLQQGVLGGLSPRLIERHRTTVATLLKEHGYHTACFGKWHLGMDWVLREGKQVTELGIEAPDQVWNVDYSQPIANGPNDAGFDEYFGISASLDMVPYTFIENHRVAVLPTAEKEFPMVLGRPKEMTRKGPAAHDFDAGDVLPALVRKAVECIGRRAAGAGQGKPFFLYLPLASPHTPIAATPEWRDKSGLNAYADFVMQTDWGIGQVLAALDEQNLAANTLVIVASDNGCSPFAQFDELLAKGHNPNYIFRGNKADIYEGGHHVPFLVRWPARVKPGTTSGRLICLSDFMATCAEIIGAALTAGAAEDSVSFLPALAGKLDEAPRPAVVHHSSNGSFAIREGAWKLALCPGSGGWSAPRPGRDDASGPPLVQLYDLVKDPGEQHNVHADYPDVVVRLTALLEKYVADGRSTPGPTQANAVPVDIWKAGKAAHQSLPRKP